MYNLLSFSFFIFSSIFVLLDQESLPYESKIADLGEIKMEYMDFGGEGPTLIWVQDFHNYFDGPYKSPEYYPFYEKLSKEFRVLAPLRPGYGKSTDIKWGYDVATQSKFLLDFMNALGIEKAVLYGRSPGNQDMTWLAEHYPERIQGLIYDGNPNLLVGCADNDIVEFVENNVVFMPQFSDKEKMRRIAMSRAFWRPEFLTNKEKRINIPTLRFLHPERTHTSPNLFFSRLEILQSYASRDMQGRDEEQHYFQELSNDSLKYTSLREKIAKCNPAAKIEDGMTRAFGENLITIWEENQDYYSKAHIEWLMRHFKEFKDNILD